MEARGREVEPARPRRRRRRALKIGAVLVAITLLAGLAGAGRLYWRYQQVPRVPFEPEVLTDAPKSGPQNFLLVGSDSRAFVNGDDDVVAYGTAEEVGEPHADTILLIRTFPDTGRAALVSFPRDLYLPIAGTGTDGRINTAIQGGPQRLVQTITERFDIPIHHYVQVDFAGFKGLVDAIGGVDINFPTPVRDWDSENGQTLTGLEFLVPGCVRLNGDEALAYVRSRHYQQLIDGEWQNDPAGDLNRIKRQQDFIHRTLRQTLSRGLLDPRRLDSLLTVGIESVTLDDQLGLSDLARLSRQFGSISPDSLQTYVVPTVPFRGPPPNRDYLLRLDPTGAEPILNVFRGQTREPELLQPNSVRTRVVDRSRTTDRVRLAAYQLAAAGFAIDEVAPGEPGRRTVVRYGTGKLVKAQLVARHLDGPAELQLDPDLRSVDVALVLGSDWRGVAETGAPPPETTTPESGAEPPPATEPSVPVAPTSTTPQVGAIGPSGGC